MKLSRTLGVCVFVLLLPMGATQAATTSEFASKAPVSTAAPPPAAPSPAKNSKVVDPAAEKVRATTPPLAASKPKS